MSLQIGRYSIDIVDTGNFYLDGGAMFGVVPKTIWSKKYNSGDEKNRIPLAANPMIIKSENKNILVDSGNGVKYSQKLIDIYGFDIEKSNLELSLNKFNLSRYDITDVILTHLHFDHAGGSTFEINGKIEPTFPNAKYYVQKEHYKWACNPTDKDRASFIKSDYEPLISDGLLEFIEGDGELFDGIHVQCVNGHTQAMQLVKVIGDDKSLLFLADLAPTHAHLPYVFSLGYDNFPLTTMAEKKKIFPRAYEEKSIVVFEHDAFLQAATLKSVDKGFEVDESIIITE